jgi:hypothetical protein
MWSTITVVQSRSSVPLIRPAVRASAGAHALGCASWKPGDNSDLPIGVGTYCGGIGPAAFDRFGQCACVGDDWFRSPAWQPLGQAEFEGRRARARPTNRPQVLRIKALALGDAGTVNASTRLACSRRAGNRGAGVGKLRLRTRHSETDTAPRVTSVKQPPSIGWRLTWHRR